MMQQNIWRNVLNTYCSREFRKICVKPKKSLEQVELSSSLIKEKNEKEKIVNTNITLKYKEKLVFLIKKMQQYCIIK